MDSELSADIARCPGADAVWCDHCRRREPSSHPMQAWMEAPACVDVRGCAWHIPHGYREPGRLITWEARANERSGTSN